MQLGHIIFAFIAKADLIVDTNENSTGQQCSLSCLRPHLHPEL